MDKPTYFTDNHAVSMTLRDYFAAKAMQGFAAMDDDCFSSVEQMAEMSYKWADAMMEAREQ